MAWGRGRGQRVQRNKREHLGLKEMLYIFRTVDVTHDSIDMSKLLR